MKVGVIAPPHEVTGGGGYTYVSMLYEALCHVDLGHDLVILDFQAIEAFPEAEIPEWEQVPAELQGRVNAKFMRSLNHHLRQSGIDLLWMVTPSTTYVPCVPYMVTVWDIAHRQYPFFPEVSTGGWSWSERENYFTTILPRATFVLTGAECGKREIVSCYGIPESRVRKLPLPAPAMVDGSISTALPIPRKYLLYPAQFWPHKNHVGAIQALRRLRIEMKCDLDLVFVGSDQGNEEFVRSLAEREGMSDYVHFAGFVSRETLTHLYRNAEALLYLSLFGPDNLPPLEAFGCGCPVVVSDHAGHREQLGEAAVYVDPLNAQDIAEGVRRLLADGNLRLALTEAGSAIVKGRSVADYLGSIRELLDEFARFQACWPAPSTATRLASASGPC